MEGDSRNPKVSLLKKFDIPVEHLSYEYIEKCSDKKELERIIRILRSGEEGSYPDLLKFTEDRLRIFAPESRVLRVETPVLTKENISNELWNTLESELLSWEKEMKEMDKSLDFEKSRIDTVGSKSMPEIRKVAPPKPKNEPKKTKVQINSKNERIKSGDYASWEKFDVDKELLKIDVEEERKQEENEKKKREIKKQVKDKKIEIQDIDKESYSSLEQQVLANQAKDRGNECYKSGDWESAIKYYDISIKLFESANAFNNRAMAYLKLKRYEEAVEDCNRVLDLEKNNIKALHRRATAYQNMSEKGSKNFDELALQDLVIVVQLEPNNKIAQADLQKLKKKLNIEDVGRKFRMPISENSQDSDKENYHKSEKKSTFNVKDEPLFSEKLPLTYYGPSTSTFQCEPYSLVHRALSGSAIPGQILCKCNSNKQKQNPLCQRCGEAMCKPKPVNKSKANVKKDNEAKNLMLKDSVNQNHSGGGDKCLSNAIRDTSEKVKVDENKQISKEEEKGCLESTSEKVDSPEKIDVTQKESVKPIPLGVCQNEKSCPKISGDDNKLEENTEVKPDLNSNIKANSNNTNHKNSSSTIIECNKKVLVGDILPSENVSLDERTKSKEDNKSNETKLKDVGSSQNETSQTSKKSKHKKKKSKERRENKLGMLMEPVKVVHAAKYLHPTSKEPKLESESPKEVQEKVKTCVEGQFKPFVRNKKSLSVEAGRMSTASGAFGAKNTERNLSENSSVKRTIIDISSEGNKENILEEKTIGNNNSEHLKKNTIDSAYEFVKTWEQLKKVDDCYVKRAEVLRNIKPCDLGKVIGIKLDSDMLSCILECLERHIVETDPNIVVEFLKQLPQVPRFGLITMFLADKDKNKMKKLVETAESKGFKLDDDTKKLLAINS